MGQMQYLPSAIDIVNVLAAMLHPCRNYVKKARSAASISAASSPFGNRWP
jgi:hypothetical protein